MELAELIEGIDKLNVRPGDTIVLTLSADAGAEIKTLAYRDFIAWIRRKIGDGKGPLDYIILPHGYTIQCISDRAMRAAGWVRTTTIEAPATGHIEAWRQ